MGTGPSAVEGVVSMVNEAFWQGKKVLITGHTGFKGSWLTMWLSLMGAEVLGYALPPITKPNLFTDADIQAMCREYVIGDVNDYSSLLKMMLAYEPEIVFHLAAQPLVQASYVHPVSTFHINVMGTAHLMEAVRHTSSVHVVINVTSDKCYRNTGKEALPFCEGDPLGGHDPYSASKACAEIVAECYRQSYFHAEEGKGPNMASVRAGNVIGGGDWSESRLMPDIIRAFTASESIVVRNPGAIRPWQHVLEPLHGYLLLAEKLWDSPQYADAWNFGPLEQSDTTVQDIIRMAADLWQVDMKVVQEQIVSPSEAPRLSLDSSKAAQLLNWRPKLSIREAVSWTLSWHQQYRSGVNARAASERQIAAYIHGEGGSKG